MHPYTHTHAPPPTHTHIHTLECNSEFGAEFGDWLILLWKFSWRNLTNTSRSNYVKSRFVILLNYCSCYFLSCNTNQAGICLFKIKDVNNRTMGETCSKLKIRPPELRQWRRSGVFMNRFEQVSHILMVFLLLNLTKKMLAGINWFLLTKIKWTWEVYSQNLQFDSPPSIWHKRGNKFNPLFHEFFRKLWKKYFLLTFGGNTSKKSIFCDWKKMLLQLKQILGMTSFGVIMELRRL